MCSFVKISDSCWQHENLACVSFPRKPPEWIAPFLIQANTAGYDLGQKHAHYRIREVFEEIGMATKSDLEAG